MYLIKNYMNLPDTIPTHYNLAGQADGFGSKQSLLILPSLMTLLFIGLTILNKYPHIFNYEVKITADNARNKYTIASRMMRMLKLSLVIIFGLLLVLSIKNASGQGQGLGSWFLPVSLALVFLPICYYFIASSKK
jgi:uncharacterized membrane protein